MKILVVEDSLFVQNVIRKVILENIEGCEVITANDGKKGYKLFLEQKPDMVTTDLLMPVVSGQELVRKVREQDHETKIIVISADVQKATRDEVEELGVAGFINKPVTGEKAELLIKLIKEAQNVK
ncbi:response regulator transcription factor [Alkalihalobacillus sp. BA299]|uniref:response regulator transcription factor n=1 Tax=Alkalihalobacillus sp. BA299 TaxID=2815938 RepID=UPI001ADC4505|nr:response regulator [Alkalihalobacillus sp. BA299]